MQESENVKKMQFREVDISRHSNPKRKVFAWKMVGRPPAADLSLGSFFIFLVQFLLRPFHCILVHLGLDILDPCFKLGNTLAKGSHYFRNPFGAKKEEDNEKDNEKFLHPQTKHTYLLDFN